MEHHEPVTDPLDVLRDQHAIMEPLLEYRRLEASTPRLAPRPLYEDVRRGRRTLGIVRVRGRLKDDTGELRPRGTASRRRLNVNKAGVDELATIPYVGQRLAERIVAYREAHGPFKRLEALEAVQGIGSKLLKQIRDHITTKEGSGNRE
jgi:competence ComEA-like helix-hairpin-helix protein